ncbi:MULTISPECIES: flagellar basal body-associated FliL family protein [Paenibacillus]|uniref:Flagellar protein FliL n=1 Tax=Paenibacillus baimaensis TaxID=2982185 RepID=A0ABT2UMV3_9BACL|nr:MULTISPECIES: flagellar basal body-associated FliL family protein [unclassified Paenibacillus]MCU6795341.1 flagellar basal body-associated FliL family protein [Paenibacillus sp. WQ 127069]OMF14614.1 flagellar basal body protein FliL [Paenibacillus sp. FSL H7-0331]
MFKSKMFLMVVAILIAITLILTAAFVLWNYMDKGNQDPQELAQSSAKEVKQAKKATPEETKANTVILKDILTNLATNNRFIKASFAIELENAKAKDEFEKLDFKMKAIIVQTLSDMTPEQVQGSKGLDNLTSTLMNKMNPLLTLGKIKQIWITDNVLQ